MGISVGLEFMFDFGMFYDYLVVGEVMIEMLIFSYMDSNGVIDMVSYIFMILGVNDVVVIILVGQSVGVIECVDDVVDENVVIYFVGDMISFDDVDLLDMYSVMVMLNDGVELFCGIFIVLVVMDLIGIGLGQVGWMFDIDDVVLEDLVEG